jgi:hypothetical protein
MVSFTPQPHYRGERVLRTHGMGGLVYPRAGLDDVKGKFLTLRGLELRPLSLQLVASRYTDSAIPALQWTNWSRNLIHPTDSSAGH